MGDASGAGRPPGQWNQWCAEYRWVERAAAYDAHLDGERRKVREQKLRELEERRFEFEMKNQTLLERRVERVEALADKAESTPITDVIQRDGDKVTKVKGLNLSAFARLLKQRDEMARLAITGVRPEQKDEKRTEETVPFVVQTKPEDEDGER